MIKKIFKVLKEKYKNSSVRRLLLSLLGLNISIFIISFIIIIIANWVLVYRINQIVEFQVGANRVIVQIMQNFTKSVYSVELLVKNEKFQKAKSFFASSIKSSINHINTFLNKKNNIVSKNLVSFDKTFLDLKSYFYSYRSIYLNYIEYQRELEIRRMAIEEMVNHLAEDSIEIKSYLSKKLTEPLSNGKLKPYYQQALTDVIMLSYEIKKLKVDLLNHINDVSIGEDDGFDIRHNLEKLRFGFHSAFLNIGSLPGFESDVNNLLDSIENYSSEAVIIAKKSHLAYQDANFYYRVIENMEYALNQDIVDRIGQLREKLISLRNKIVFLIFGSIGLSVIFLFIFIYIIKNRIFYPFNEFLKAIQFASKGKRDIHININTDDEFKLLAEHFNKMTDAIKDRESELIYEKDLVEKKSNELNSLKRYIEDVIHASPNAIFTVDRNLNILFLNKKALNLIKDKNIVGKKLTEIQCTLKNYLDDINEVLASESEKVLEKREIEFPGYDKGIVNIYIYPLHTIGGTGAVIEIEDVTEKVVMEEKMLESQKMETVGLLAGGFAHDFNNLLTGLMGYIELAMMSKDHEKIITYLEKIKDISIHASKLVQQILLFSRSGYSKKEMIDIGVVIDGVLSMIKSPIKRDIHLVKEIREKLKIYGDASQLTQAILNIVLNSFEAVSGKKDGFIKIKAEKIRGDNEKNIGLKSNMEYVKITIEDNGVGMSEDVKSRIFEPFFTTKTRGNIKGTGLGLSIVYRVIKNHDGEILVNSAEGEGSSFEIYLPIKEEENILKRKVKEKKRLQGSGKILLVDDEDMIREVGKEILEHLGYNVIPLKSGKECIEYFKNNKDNIDLIIIDLIMPEMDGPETLRELSNMGIKIPVLIASGYITLDMSYLKDYDYIKGIIHKPYSIDDISLKLERILKK